MDSYFDRIHPVTSIISHVKTPSLQTKGTSCTRPSVGANLFLKRELENKQKTIDKLFNILHNNNSEITKQFFLYKNSAEKIIRIGHGQ